MCKIILSYNSLGFCNGVKTAVKIAEESIKKTNKLFCIGKLIHNEEVLTQLQKQGLILIDNEEEIPPFSNVLIRAHGCPKETTEKLKRKGCSVIDATCLSVKLIHNKVIEYMNRGYKIIIYGEKNHPEVKGINSMSDYRGIIIEDIKDFSFLKEGEKFLVVFQTTFNTQKHAELLNKLQYMAIKNDKLVDIFDSICYTTLARRKGCKKVLSLSDLAIVLGDKNSNNTRELYNTAKTFCNDVYYLSNLEESKEVIGEIINKKRNIGIITGASTPDRLIMEVIALMKEENPNIEVVNIDETNIVSNEKASTDVVDVPSTQKQENVSKTENETKETMDTVVNFMDKVMDSIPEDKKQRPLRKGQILDVEVVEITEEGDLKVSWGGESATKNDLGSIPKSEISENIIIQVGDNIQAVVIDTNQKHEVGFSQKESEKILQEEKKIELLKAGKDVEVKCTGIGANDSGLQCKVGRYEIFVPKSQIHLRMVKNLKPYLGKMLNLRLLPPKEDAPAKKSNSRTLYAGQRAILQEKEDIFWNEIAIVGNVVKGTVARYGVKDNHIFGAFISVAGHDCLAHISELSWDRINDPSEVLEKGKEYNFVVLEADKEKNKVSLGYRQLQKAPIDIIAEKYPEGSIVEGKVERIMPFGAFVSIGEKVDGLVHISQISHQRVEDINEFVKVGDTVSAQVIKYEGSKVSLSMKALIEPTYEEDAKVIKTRKKTEKLSPDYGREIKGKGRRRELVESKDYISSTTTGATFGDTEQAQKLMRQLEEQDGNE